MKILEGTPVSGQPPSGTKAPEKNSPTGPTFNEILKETVDAPSDNDRQIKVATVAPPAPAEPAALQVTALPSDRPAIDRIERFIDVMDDYRCKLSDPQCTLKQIQPYLEKMNAERANMQLLLDDLPDQEPLKDLLNRALVTASAEAWKFNRGDYI